MQVQVTFGGVLFTLGAEGTKKEVIAALIVLVELPLVLPPIMSAAEALSLWLSALFLHDAL
jgi:hypothetical protein